MGVAKSSLKCKLLRNQPHTYSLTVAVPASYVDIVFEHAAEAQRNNVNIPGFEKGAAPIAYIYDHYRSILCDHAKEFLFKYFVIHQLYKKLHTEKVCMANQPRITDIYVEPHKDALFHLEVMISPHIELKSWKHFPFKAPKRKKYKDIDKQVDLFIKEESTAEKDYPSNGVSVGDWVSFTISLINNDKHPLFDEHQETLWVKIGNEEADALCRELFLDKKIGERFHSNSQCLQEYFSEKLNAKHYFCVEIKDIVPYQFFSLDDFKHHFKLKNQKELHQKLIEVFSFRNDISQRRSMVEEAFKVLFAKHPIDIPNHLILRQQRRVLENVQENPDYHVYKTEKRFKEYVRLLAMKQVREELMINHICINEKISVSHKDIRAYLNFTKRARMKEFLYFLPPVSKMHGHEIPLSHTLIKECCMKEKAINHVIYNLIKK